MVIRVLKYRGFPVRLSNGRSLGTHSGDRLEQIRHMNNPLLVKPVQFALGLRDIKQGEDGRVLDQSHVELTYPTLDITPKSYASLSQLGKPRTRCFSLPPSNFTYGMKNICVDGGAAEALANWYVMPSGSMQKEKALERDFISLNKAAVESGLTTAREQSHFRATHDIRRKPADSAQAKTGKSIQFPPDMTFGISTRPSTPVFELLRHKYQAMWLEDMKEAQRQSKETDTQKKRRLGNIRETQASILRRYTEPVDPGPYWHMKRFQSIPAQLDTFRSPTARTAAFHHHASDATSRTGIFGHGIYAAAQS